MTNQKYDYEKLQIDFLEYLFNHIHEADSAQRITSKIEWFFKISSPTFNCIIYELKGAGLVGFNVIGNAKVWFITDDGIIKLQALKRQKINKV